VNRPNRQHRRRFGKHDTADAEAAARTVQANTVPPASPRKAADGTAEMVRALRVVRRSAVSRRVRRRPTNSARSWSPRQKDSGRSCAASRRLGWSPRPRASVHRHLRRRPAGRDETGDESARPSPPQAL
jgi:hypothetical protein